MRRRVALAACAALGLAGGIATVAMSGVGGYPAEERTPSGPIYDVRQVQALVRGISMAWEGRLLRVRGLMAILPDNRRSAVEPRDGLVEDLGFPREGALPVRVRWLLRRGINPVAVLRDPLSLVRASTPNPLGNLADDPPDAGFVQTYTVRLHVERPCTIYVPPRPACAVAVLSLRRN